MNCPECSDDQDLDWTCPECALCEEHCSCLKQHPTAEDRDLFADDGEAARAFSARVRLVAPLVQGDWDLAKRWVRLLDPSEDTHPQHLYQLASRVVPRWPDVVGAEDAVMVCGSLEDAEAALRERGFADPAAATAFAREHGGSLMSLICNELDDAP